MPHISRPVIYISTTGRQLSLADGQRVLFTYPIAIGKAMTPTPLGDFYIVSRIMYPGGILGTRWLGLNYDAYGIHGTNRPESIGQMASNGCIRLHNHHVEVLFDLTPFGTPVYIRS
ncbi:MAG: L,D-transpeptidase [Selenomonadales bacterium]|nr:L,D-transpeptidase [Selenomonadales bacterium]